MDRPFMFGSLDAFIQTSPVFAGVFLVLFIVILGFFAAVLLKSPRSASREYQMPTVKDFYYQEVSNLDFMGHVNRANELLAQYDYDRALLHFQEALKLKNDPFVHFKIGRVFVQKDDMRGAVMAFRNVLQLNPSMLDAHFELARIYQNQNNLNQAHQELNQALTLKPDHEECLKMKVKLLEQEEKFDEALPLLRRLIDNSGMRQGIKYRVTYADYLVRIGRYEEAIMEYENLLQADPAEELTYRLRLGQTWYDFGQYPQSVEQYRSALAREELFRENPQGMQDVRARLAAALCNEGVGFYEQGEYGRAIQRYEEALTFDTQNVDIYYNLGKAYAKTKDAAKAMEYFEKAIELAPGDVSSYFELALLQDERGMVQEAIRSYQRVLALDPNHLQATYGLGTLYGVDGDFDQSIEYLSQAVRINPTFVDAIYNLAVALERKEEIGKAIQMYKRVLALDKEHEKARSNLTLLKRTKIKDAG